MITAFCRVPRVFAPSSRYRRMSPNRAKYGDDSVFFDLSDMENTIGSWEMYGQDDQNRYPAMQGEFFNRAGQALNRRESMLAFCAMAGTLSVLVWGAKGSKDAGLPIVVGPQKAPQVAPRGRI